MGQVAFSLIGPTADAARWAMGQYVDELAGRFPVQVTTRDALDSTTTAFEPPGGVFVLACDGGDTVGCGAVQFLDASTGEIKRMWVAPSARGRGTGRLLLAELEHHIIESGRERAVLDTNSALTEAIAMYRSCGYAQIAPYNDNADADRWFAKGLRWG